VDRPFAQMQSIPALLEFVLVAYATPFDFDRFSLLALCCQFAHHLRVQLFLFLFLERFQW